MLHVSELGIYPLHYDIVSRLHKYCFRLENLTREFPLLKDAYLCSKELHLNAPQTTWYSSIEKLLKFLDIQNMSHTKKDFGTSLKQSLNERKSEQAHIAHAPTLLENAVYNEWQFQALGTGNWTKKGI